LEVLVWTSKQPWRMRQAAAGSDNAAADHTVATGWMGKGLWHIQHACTTTVAHYKTRWKTKARARCRVVIWLTSDLTLMCVRAEQEHSSLMDDYHLGCKHSCDLLPWKKVTCTRNPVYARACMQKPTTWLRRDEMALVCPD